MLLRQRITSILDPPKSTLIWTIQSTKSTKTLIVSFCYEIYPSRSSEPNYYLQLLHQCIRNIPGHLKCTWIFIHSTKAAPWQDLKHIPKVWYLFVILFYSHQIVFPVTITFMDFCQSLCWSAYSYRQFDVWAERHRSNVKIICA